MLEYLVLILLFITTALGANIPEKCCSGELEEIYLQNNTYTCQVNKESRWEFLLNTTKLEEQSGFCLDVHDSSLQGFKLNNDSFLKTNVFYNYYRKCCGLEYTYDPKTHSCVKSNFKDELPSGVYKIGLNSCKIIMDNVYSDEYFKFSLYSSKQEENEELRCNDKTVDGKVVERVCKEDYEICKTIRCIHKCCQDGESFVNGSFCKYTHGIRGVDLTNFKTIEETNGQFALIHGHSALYVYTKNFSLDKYGIFSTIDDNSQVHFTVESQTYCIEHAIKESANMSAFYLFRLFSLETSLGIKFIINRWVMLISCIFLISTIIIYIIIKETRTLFGKTLVSFCSALLMVFSLIIYPTFKTSSPTIICRTLGFILLYSVYSSFLWLNVMCFDIYRSFGNLHAKGDRRKSKQMRIFCFYSLYGWGLPLGLTMIDMLIYSLNILPVPIQFDVGIYKCYIHNVRGSHGVFLFLLLPLTVIEILNVFWFFKTVRYCLKVRDEINKMNESYGSSEQNNSKYSRNRERCETKLGFILKLSVIMGISFMFEIVSSFFDFQKNTVTKYIEIAWDFINSLQGVFIFIIFICKKKIINSFRQKLGLNMKRISSMATESTCIPSSRHISEENINKCGKKSDSQL